MGKGCRDRVRGGGGAGFSLIEVLIGMTILGIAVIGLAQLFVLSIANNKRGAEISQATFLAQQQVDYLRSLTGAELNGFPSSSRGESADEAINMNGDDSIDFRRLTRVTAAGGVFEVQVLVFPAAALGVAASDLVQNPANHRVRALVNTLIAR